MLLMQLRQGRGGDGITAYNCTHEDVTSEEFSLLLNAPCPDFRTSHVYREEYISIQLLQKKEYSDVHGFGAKVIRTLFIFRCNGEPVTHAYHQRVLGLSRETVMAMYRSGLYKDEWLSEISGGTIGVTFNGTAHKTRNLKGWTTPDGYCGGEEFSLHGEDYVDAVMQGTYEVLLYDGTMTVDLENDLVRTFAGSTCDYSRGHCEDYIYGDIYWDREEHDTDACTPTMYLVLYEGKAVVQSYRATKITEATRITTVTAKTIAFSLVQTEQTQLCRLPAYRTEHPKLLL